MKSLNGNPERPFLLTWLISALAPAAHLLEGALWVEKWTCLPRLSDYFFSISFCFCNLLPGPIMRTKIGFIWPLVIVCFFYDGVMQGRIWGWNLGCAQPWHVRCFSASIEALSFCHGASFRGETAWSTMEENKTVLFSLLLATQFCLSSAQVLRIGKRNSCLRTALVGVSLRVNWRCIYV